MKLHGIKFLVTSETDKTVLTATELWSNDEEISWMDQNDHERLFGIERVIEDEDTKFVFERSLDEGGGVYCLQVLVTE